ncbi:LAMI_0E12288g1_1 [Lachancea mirantina]|uniref:Pre-mRNA-splicing factor CWC21 n=1 Tax=Lachancea mirantina TaxID=1230905 RepID=A0A1G4JQ28_9SACH|nr:LAMI_0E12288g1_1 [Lachancea mirantina]
MSYNGIGLRSAKGSSTSGHIQQSLAFNENRKGVKNFLNRVEKKKPRQTVRQKDQSIINHMEKREIELRVSEHRDMLEEEGLDDPTIEARCEEFRKKIATVVEKERADEKTRNAYKSRRLRSRDAELKPEAEPRKQPGKEKPRQNSADGHQQ